MGFALTPDGMFYVFGGYDTGKKKEEVRWLHGKHVEGVHKQALAGLQ